MHTIWKKLTYVVAQVATPVMDIRVSRNRAMSIHAVTTDATGGTLTSFYVFKNPNDGTETEVQYTTKTMTAGTLAVLEYAYKVDFIRLKYTSGGVSGELLLSGTVSQ